MRFYNPSILFMTFEDKLTYSKFLNPDIPYNQSHYIYLPSDWSIWSALHAKFWLLLNDAFLAIKPALD